MYSFKQDWDLKSVRELGFVSGHDFSRAVKVLKENGLYRLRKKSIAREVRALSG
jgi:hypothetical protein